MGLTKPSGSPVSMTVEGRRPGDVACCIFYGPDIASGGYFGNILQISDLLRSETYQQGIADEDRYEAIGYQNCSAMGVQFSIEPSGAVFACKALALVFQ
jgi:hypothetical protein